jgi:hypothetical protein
MEKELDRAIIARIFPVRKGEKCLTAGSCTDAFELEPLVPREDLPKLTICTKHRKAIYFEGFGCPCCEILRENAKQWAEKEFLALTREMGNAQNSTGPVNQKRIANSNGS